MFKAMVAALVERPDEGNNGGALDQHRKEISQPTPMGQQHMSLVKADPNAFYADTLFFDKLPARVRCSRSRACGTVIPLV